MLHTAKLLLIFVIIHSHISIDIFLNAYKYSFICTLLKESLYRTYVLYVIARSHRIDRQYDSSK